MNCPRCQGPYATDAVFCDRCGFLLGMICPHCGGANRREAAICKHCGEHLGRVDAVTAKAGRESLSPDTYTPKYLATKILASRYGLEGERKQVTVLFADIAGSTTWVEDRDPEEVRKLLDPILQTMMRAVHRYEGTVNQVLGDGIMALFGAPLAHEDHALRACYAALAMQEAMRRDSEEVRGPRRLEIRVGLNSGEVVVRAISNDLHIDYSAIGHTTHLAARMEELAAPGSVMMTSTTLREVEGFVQVRSLGAVQAKGISRPVEAFELLRATSVRKRFQAAAVRGLTQFVGRETEMELFREVVEQAGSGHGQILAMVGEPGVGKSRLIYELIHSFLPKDWLVLEGTSVSYGRAVPYYPLIELLRQYFEIPEGEKKESIQGKVEAFLLGLDATFNEAIPPILALLDALPDSKMEPPLEAEHTEGRHPQITEAIKRFGDLDPQQRRRQTLEMLKRVFIRESQRQPLMLIFEDLQWVDNETQAFLDHLVESLPGARILFLVNYRPGYGHTWANKTYYTRLRVNPLPSKGSDELLQFLLGHARELAPVKTLLVESTEGNPFFLEESVRSLAETGVLAGEKGDYRLALKTLAIRIPNSVQAVLADRVDRLKPEEKHLLQTAAVIGVKVPFWLLREIANLPEEEIYRCLADLQAAEFLYESNLFPQMEYSFKHALTNEVVYRALLHDHRVALHARIVNALEEMGSENLQDQMDRLAHHAFRGEVWDKAARYLRAAGLKSLARSANREAVAFFERAISVLQHLPTDRETMELAVDLRLDLRNALFLLGEFERIRACLNDAQKVAEGLGDRCRLRRVLNFRLSYFSLTGEPERVIEFGQRALDPAMACEDPGVDIVTHSYMGIAYHTMGDYRQAVNILNRAVAMIEARDLIAERFGTSTLPAVSCRTWLVQSLAQTGLFGEGISCAHEGMRIAEQINQAYSLAYVTCSLGFLLVLKGDLDAAIDMFLRCLRLCEESNIRVLFPQIASYLGFAYALSGRIDEGRPLLEKAEEQTVSIGRRGGQALRVAWQGECYLMSGRVEEARILAKRALELSDKHKERGHSAWALKLLGEIALSQDAPDLEQGEVYYRRALTVADELGMRPLRAHCHSGLGKLYLKKAQLDRARTELSSAIELYRAMKMAFWLPEAETAWEELGVKVPSSGTV